MKTDARACPHCHAVPDPATGACGCATVSSEHAPAGTPSATLVARAESLFETYLAARLVRARRQLTAAKVALLRDPRNRAKLDDLRRVEQEAERLQAQLVEQARRAAQAREQQRAADTRAAEPATGVSAQPTEDFRVVQAVMAEEVYNSGAPSQFGPRAQPDDRDCPRCGRRLAGDSAACTCGYQFVPAALNAISEPFLTEEELAALRKAAKR